MDKLNEYEYIKKGNMYYIYKIDYCKDGITESSVVRSEKVYDDREEARKRVYELNGWRYNVNKT